MDLNVPPYYDDFDPSKGYTKVLTIPGRRAQSRDLVVAQSMFNHSLKQLGDSLLSDGNILSGMAMIKVSPTEVVIESGKVYLDGMVRDFHRSQITIRGTGSEEIGVKLRRGVVTELEDNTLRDPAQGAGNYGSPGAHRLKEEVELSVDDESSYTIYKLLDGDLFLEPQRPQVDILNEVMAKRTYDESGNYRVEGFTLGCEPLNADNVSLYVEAGRAYILGYEVNKPTSTRVLVPKSKESRLIQNESKVYATGTSLYPLDNSPAKLVSKVMAEVRVAKKTMIRGSQLNGSDAIGYNSVTRINRVWTENASGEVVTEYTADTDFQLVNSNSVSWGPSGSEPGIGTTYFVSFDYTKTLVPGTDYQLKTPAVDGQQVYQIEFLSGDKPIDGTRFYTDYEFYLARKDLVSIDGKGNIIVTRGQSDLIGLVNTPSYYDTDVLHLGTILLPPNSSEGVTNSYAVTRISMEGLQQMLRRLEDIEYNQAMSALDEEALFGEDASTLKGIFSDGFSSISKSDTTHPDFNISFSLETGELTLPTDYTDLIEVTPEPTSNAKAWDRLITLPCREVQTIRQPFATTTMLVNPYNVFNQLATLKAIPDVDNWIEETEIVIEKTATKSYTINRWWYSGGTPYTDTEKYLYENMILDSGQNWNSGSGKTGVIISNSSRVILDEAVQFIRPRSVDIEAKNLLPMSDNLTGYFDGIKVDLVPRAGTVAGSTTGTLRSNNKGEARGSFTIPEGVRVGTRELTLKNDNNTAIATYTANGRKRTVEKTVLTTRVTANIYDPLAQSFQFDTDVCMSSVDLYFASKSATSNVVIQVRDMINGYPGTTIFAEKVLESGQVNISENASTVTKVTFDDPVVCKANTQYCVTIITDSDAYSMFIAELGKKDISTGAVVSSQPYLAGTMFSSANALTWTAHQTMDLKFAVYTLEFDPEGVLDFPITSNLGIDGMVLFTEYLTPQKSKCLWEARFKYEGDSVGITEKPFQPLFNYQEVDLPSKATQVQLRAKMELGTSAQTSPVLLKSAINIIGFNTKQTGCYISRTVYNTPEFTTVRQSIEAHLPSGCAVTPSFSLDGGQTWYNYQQLGVTPTVEQTSDPGFSRITYAYTLPGGTKGTNFKCRLDMSSQSPTVKPRARKFINIMK